MKYLIKKIILPMALTASLIVSVSAVTIADPASEPENAQEQFVEDTQAGAEGSEMTPEAADVPPVEEPEDPPAEEPEDPPAEEPEETPLPDEETEPEEPAEETPAPDEGQTDPEKAEGEDPQEEADPAETPEPAEEGDEDPELMPEPEEGQMTETDDFENPDFVGPDWEDEESMTEEEEEEQTPTFAGESGTADFDTLPLLELSAKEFTICAFFEGKEFGNVQKAALFGYLSSYIEGSGGDTDSALLDAFGVSQSEFEKYCDKNDLDEDAIRSKLQYLYSVLFKNAEKKDTKDRFVSAFRSAKTVKAAVSNLYAAASARNIRLPYTKENIISVVVPKAQHYLDLFGLGGKQREGTAKVAYFCQGNYANVPYSDGTVADSGCGITSFSMAASELTGLNLGPEVTATWANENGVDTVTNWGAYWWLAERFGLKFMGQYAGGFDTAVEALKEGNLVVASLRQDGFFTTSALGHYILLTGVEKDGRICVNDPASYERSVYGPFTYDKVFGGCIQYWIFGR